MGELDLVETVQHIKANGYAYIHDPTTSEFNDRLRRPKDVPGSMLCWSARRLW